MTTFSACSKRQRIALLALVGGLAAAAAPRAAAEDVLPAAPRTALPDAGAIAAAAVAATVPVGIELPAPPVPVPAPEPEPAEQPEPEQAPEQSEPAEAEPPPAPAVEPPVPPVPAPDPLPAVSQVEPVNVNVSIRIDSPGDDGAVTQANVAVAAGPPAAPTVPEARYHEEPPQYRPAPAAEPAAAPAPAAPAPAPEAPQASWTWNWDCGNGLPSGFTPPAGTMPQSWIWNWTGNCGGSEPPTSITPTQNTPQYQPGVTQYQPVNVNVSIRIASPGSNGPVVQANVAVAVALPPLPAAPALPVVQPPTPLPSPPVESAAPVPAPSEAPPAPAPVAAPPVGEPPAGPTDDPEAPLLVATPSAALPTPPSSEPAALAAERELAGARTPSARIHVTAQLVQRLAAPRPAFEAAARSRVPEQRRPRTPQPADLTREQVVALGSVSPGPAAPDRAPLLLFVFLAAFVLALADAAWRVRDEWRTAAAEPGRRRERPG